MWFGEPRSAQGGRESRAGPRCVGGAIKSSGKMWGERLVRRKLSGDEPRGSLTCCGRDVDLLSVEAIDAFHESG